MTPKQRGAADCLNNCKVELINGVPPEDVLSINTPQQLAEVDSILSTRVRVEEKA